MIYKRLSRKELLKALQDHASVFCSEGSIRWQKDMDCYCLSLNGTRVFIDKFEMNTKLEEKITMFKVIKVSAYDLSFDIMLGVIETSDWLVEIPEEGEE